MHFFLNIFNNLYTFLPFFLKKPYKLYSVSVSTQFSLYFSKLYITCALTSLASFPAVAAFRTTNFFTKTIRCKHYNNECNNTNWLLHCHRWNEFHSTFLKKFIENYHFFQFCGFIITRKCLFSCSCKLQFWFTVFLKWCLPWFMYLYSF